VGIPGIASPKDVKPVLLFGPEQLFPADLLHHPFYPLLHPEPVQQQSAHE
jgi:hypothetical protein